jgi:hypothetical protein
MYPAIRDGDIVEIMPVNVSLLRRGDVLLCRTGSGAVAHRLLRMAGEGNNLELELRGDAGFAMDVPVPWTNVIGRVVTVRRNGIERALDSTAARLRDVTAAGFWRVKRWIVQRLFARITQTSARSSQQRP